MRRPLALNQEVAEFPGGWPETAGRRQPPSSAITQADCQPNNARAPARALCPAPRRRRIVEANREEPK